MAEFVKDKIGIEIKVRKAKKLGERRQKEIVLAEIEYWQMKRELMEKNKRLD